MTAIVNLKTWSDADFIRAFTLSQSFPPWDAEVLWVTADVVDYAGRVWTAAANSTNVVPGTDGTKWTLTARPGLDLTGASLNFMVRRSGDATEALIALTSVASAGIAISVTPTDGKFTLAIPIARLAGIAAGSYVHSLIRTHADGIKEAVWHGTLQHQIGPTR